MQDAAFQIRLCHGTCWVGLADLLTASRFTYMAKGRTQITESEMRTTLCRQCASVPVRTKPLANYHPLCSCYFISKCQMLARPTTPAPKHAQGTHERTRTHVYTRAPDSKGSVLAWPPLPATQDAASQSHPAQGGLASNSPLRPHVRANRSICLPSCMASPLHCAPHRRARCRFPILAVPQHLLGRAC